MICYYHPDREATAVCAMCGKAICPDCAVEANGMIQCRTCYATYHTPQYAPAAALPSSRMALTSMILGLGGWLAWALLLCFNMTVGTLFASVTMGLGALCLLPLTLFPYLGWIAAVVTGHLSLKKINQGLEPAQGRGMAITGLISSYLALGLTLFACLLGTILAAAGVSIPLIGNLLDQAR